MTMAEPPPAARTFFHSDLVHAALQEWADLVRLVYAPIDPRVARSAISETYEPSSAVRTARATNEQANPLLSALLADERAGRRLARTVHDFLMREGRDRAMLLWLEQEGNTHEEIGKTMKMRKALVGTAIKLVKIDLGIYLLVVTRPKAKT